MGEKPRRGRERLFLVVVDESPEMLNALRYACRRAKRTGGRVALLYVMDPPESQQWGGVADLMRQEARQQAEQGGGVPARGPQEPRQQAEQVVGVHAEPAATLTGQPPAIHIREGKSREELLK